MLILEQANTYMYKGISHVSLFYCPGRQRGVLWPKHMGDGAAGPGGVLLSSCGVTLLASLSPNRHWSASGWKMHVMYETRLACFSKFLK